MTEHPLAELSAFADGALAAERSAAVHAHLGGCGECRTRLAELRGVARLMSALPSAVPSRSLIPRVATRPSWLAPLRTLSAIASGAFVFLFIASTMLSLQPPTETSRTAPEGRALFATPVFGPISPLAPAGPVGPAGSAAAAGAAAPAAVPAPNQKSDVASAAASITADARTAASPTASATATGTGPVAALSRQPAPSGPGAAVLLAFAVVFAVIAIALQRRLRKA